METLRLTFSKTGRARFISHLDLMRVFQRAFYRAELPLRYTQGFNPHVVMSIALPLPVGQSGLREILDLGIEGAVDLPALPECLNRLLPEGVAVLSAELNGRPAKEIVWARYTLKFRTGTPPEAFIDMFAGPLVVEKRTKKGSRPTDLLPMIRAYACKREEDVLTASMELAAQNPTLNPEYIASEFERRMGQEILSDITRVALLDASGR